jgi:hypothetical protein
MDLGGGAVQPECGNFGNYHKRGLCNECAKRFNVEAGTFIQPEARRLCEANRVNVGSDQGWNTVDGLDLPSPFTEIAQRPPLIGDCILTLDEMDGWSSNSYGWVVDACPRTQTVTAAMGNLCGGSVFIMPRHSFVILERAKLMLAQAQQMIPSVQAVAQASQAMNDPHPANCSLAPSVEKKAEAKVRDLGGRSRCPSIPKEEWVQRTWAQRLKMLEDALSGSQTRSASIADLAACVNPAAGLHHLVCPNRRTQPILSAWARAPSSPPSENGNPWPRHEDLDYQPVTSDEDLDYQPVTSEQMYACAAVKARAHFRACVHRWLEREKQEPELRKERTSIFEDKMYARCNFVDQRECIIDALREIGECLCRRPGDASCEMCLADMHKTGASSGQPGTSGGCEC